VPGAPIILAGTRFVYDGLPEGQFSNGRVTSRIVERYGDGALLGEFVAEQTQYDPATAVPTRVLRARSLGTSTIQTTDFVYDRYRATLAQTTLSATDVDVQLTRKTSTPVWPTIPAEVTEPAGEKYATVRDVFGRPKEFQLQPAGEQPYVQRRIEYQDAASPRSITSRSFYGSTPASSTSTERSLLTKTYADALGRELYSTSDLGGDYANAVLVSGLKLYDAWGRVQYEAAPFQASPAFTPPPASQMPYGTTYAYDAGSRILRVVHGPGLQPYAGVADAAQDIYPTVYEHLWSNGLAFERVRGPTEVDPSSNTYGHYDETVLTGSERSISTSRWNSSGARIDHVQREIDRLGRLTATRRYKDAAAGTGTVDWLMKVDSLGNVIEQSEPNMAPVKTTYDEWGAAIQSEWESSGYRHVTKWLYDGFGRLTDRVLEAIPSGQASGTQESVEFYYYDHPSGDPNHPGASSTFLGRLSWAEAKNVSTEFYTYDGAGRQVASTTVHMDEGKAYRTRTKFSAVGHVDGVVFEFPNATGATQLKEEIDYGFDSAARMKTVKYFDGASTSTLLTASTIDALGRYRAITLGNGVTETYDYQSAGRQELSKWEVHTSADWRTVSYDIFDAEMRVKKMGERTRTSLSDTTPYAYTSFAYDGVDRLTDAITMKGSTALANHHYTYDGLGNTTRSSDLLSSGKSFDLTYTSGDPDRLFEQVFSGITPTKWRFAYDGAGNVINAQQTSGFPSQPARGFTYDAASRILAMYKGSWNAGFKYGPGGDLAIEEVKNGSTLDRRIRHYGALMEQRTRSSGASAVERYIPGPLGAFATIRGIGSGRTITYTHADGRANRFFTRSDGLVIESADYQPYGRIKTSTGTPSTQDYSDNLFNDGDTYAEFGITILGRRIYDPELGRFLQRDPIAFGGQSTKGNPYAFSFNDPINKTDPTGLSPEDSGVEDALPLPLPWCPGNQPAQLYRGNFAHVAIAQFYSDKHEGERVFTNHVSVAAVLRRLGYDPSRVAPEFLTFQKDIVNGNTGEVYEIKERKDSFVAGVEVAIYVTALRKGGMPAVPGNPHAEGTYGILGAPGGWITFSGARGGKILYEYIRSPVVENCEDARAEATENASDKPPLVVTPGPRTPGQPEVELQRYIDDYVDDHFDGETSTTDVVFSVGAGISMGLFAASPLGWGAEGTGAVVWGFKWAF
jgi:RHS repeat-associated protein